MTPVNEMKSRLTLKYGLVLVIWLLHYLGFEVPLEVSDVLRGLVKGQCGVELSWRSSLLTTLLWKLLLIWERLLLCCKLLLLLRSKLLLLLLRKLLLRQLLQGWKLLLSRKLW